MNESQQTFPLVAKTTFGLETILAEELAAIGAQKIVPQNRAVSFEGDIEMMYKANLHLRTALRILKPLRSFRAANPDALYREVRKINWSNYFDGNATIAVDSVVKSRFFSHSGFVSQKTKDAIVDQFRSRTGKRPNVDPKNAKLRIQVHLMEQNCSVSMDSSGSSLHLRGYRAISGAAPLSEVLAAGMIMLSGWNGDTSLVDPMCGSGTILTEAGLIAKHIAPGSFRDDFGFMHWRNYQPGLWSKLKQAAAANERPNPVRIIGCDLEGKVVGSTRANLQGAGLTREIEVSRSHFDSLVPPEGGGMLICNPPYGQRIQENDLNGLYKQLGDRLKSAYEGYEAWILSANKEALKHLGLQTSKRLTLYNGQLECKYHRYSMYAGSRKGES